MRGGIQQHEDVSGALARCLGSTICLEAGILRAKTYTARDNEWHR